MKSALMAACILVAATAWALPGSSFESGDGNLVVDVSGGEDWTNAPGLQTATDRPTGSTDDSFGQGTKEDKPVPTIVSGSIPNNKSDLDHFYFSSEAVNSKIFMYLGWSRKNTLGNANVDFEFNQSPTLSANGVTPVRTAGDMLITFDFEQGGSRPSLGMLTWLTGGSASQCFAGNALPCWGRRVDLGAAGYADGAVNASGPVVDPISGGTIPLLAFGEAAIDLTGAIGLDPNACAPFGSAFVKSRSSSSFTAEAKDFIAPINVIFVNCGGLDIHKQDDAGGALAGASFQLFGGSPNGTACTGAAVSPAKTCTTDAGGDCAMSSVPLGTYCLVETVTPAGYYTVPAQAVTLTPSTPSVSLTLTDPRKFRIIAFVCREADSALYQGTASLSGGLAVPTLQASDLPAGLSEATVCSLPAAKFGGLNAGTSNPVTVGIP